MGQVKISFHVKTQKYEISFRVKTQGYESPSVVKGYKPY